MNRRCIKLSQRRETQKSLLFHLQDILKKGHSIVTESRSMVVRVGWGKGVTTEDQQEGILGVMETICILILAVTTACVSQSL